MERFYKDPRTLVRLRDSVLGAYVDAFAQQMSEHGYAKASCRYALQLLADLARWLNRRRMIAPQLTPKHLESYLKYRSRHNHHRSGDAAKAPSSAIAPSLSTKRTVTAARWAR